MSIFIIATIGIVSLVLLLSPFLGVKREKNLDRSEGNDRQEKEYVFSQLADLEHDFHMGKISKSDFEKTKAELTVKAVKFVQPLENKWEQTQSEVDKEIQAHLVGNGLAEKKEA